MAYTTHLTSALHTANRHLDRYSRLQSDSIARLSSGRRSYNASDDISALSTGLQLRSERLGLYETRNNIELSEIAMRSASSGLSAIEFSLGEARSLASRAASDSLTDEERAIASEEFEQLMRNVNSLAESTKIGSKALLSTGRITASVGQNGIGADNSIAFEESETHGFVWHDFTTRADVSVAVQGSRYKATVSFGDYSFTGLSPTATGQNFILTSEDGYTQLALSMNVPADIAAFRTALETTFDQNQKIRIGTDAIAATVDNTATGANVDLSASSGFFSGRATNIGVRATTSGYSATLRMDTGQSFFAQKTNADTRFEFIDTADPANKIVMDGLTAGANNAATLQENLYTYLNIDNGGAVFTSGSAAITQRTGAAANDISVNGFDGKQSIKAGVGTVSGSYAFSYDSAARMFRVSNGTQSIRVEATHQDRQIISFGNGIVIQLGSPGDPFDERQDIAQRTFTINTDSESSLDVGLSTDGAIRKKINFAQINSHSLGLDALNLADKNSASLALEHLDFAMAFTGASLAALGGHERAFGVLATNTSDLISTHQEAENAFLNVNIGKELTLQTEYQTKAQTAAFSFATVREVPQRLLDLLIR